MPSSKITSWYLWRFCQNPHGTWGVVGELDYYGRPLRPLFYSLQRPWDNNTTNISCVVPGRYTYLKWHSPHFKRDLFQMANPPEGRTSIEIHPANLVTEIKGCTALGMALGYARDLPHAPAWLEQSGEALDKFMSMCDDKRITIDMSYHQVKEFPI